MDEDKLETERAAWALTRSSRPASFDHDAFIYSSDHEYTTTLVPLLEEALDAGDEVFAVVDPHNEGLLRGALGRSAGGVHWMDATGQYDKPVRTIAAYDSILRSLPPGTSAFVLGEVEFGADERSWLEWTRYESVANDVFAQLPFRAVCAYDERRLPGQVVENACRTHPELLTAEGCRMSESYCRPGALLSELRLPTELPRRPADVELEDAELTPRTARDAVEEATKGSGFTSERIAELTLGVSEVVTNALVHGRRPVRLRLWTGDALVCTVEDSGPGSDDQLLGFCPPDRGSEHSRGLWLARHVFDTVEIDAPGLGGLVVTLAASVLS